MTLSVHDIEMCTDLATIKKATLFFLFFHHMWTRGDDLYSSYVDEILDIDQRGHWFNNALSVVSGGGVLSRLLPIPNAGRCPVSTAVSINLHNCETLSHILRYWRVSKGSMSDYLESVKLMAAVRGE